METLFFHFKGFAVKILLLCLKTNTKLLVIGSVHFMFFDATSKSHSQTWL